MKIILLSGGSGKRLWPLSNDVLSKQFLTLLPAPDGGEESMIQRVVRQIRESGVCDSVTIATGEAQVGFIDEQLGRDVGVVTEPSRRDTFPAIALAAAYLHSSGAHDDETVVVMPCDVFTDGGYFATLGRMADKIESGAADLVLMGIRPTGPSTKFGYVVPGREIPDGCYLVEKFTEKPDAARAEELIARNAFWNGGVFAFRLGYLMDIVRRYSDNVDFGFLRDNFDLLPKISFDYEVAEKAESVAVVPFGGVWKDLGTWDALTDQLPYSASGRVVADCSPGTTVINRLDIPVVCTGVGNVVVVASPEGILIADRGGCESIKRLVAGL